ncbi:hypothetical protein AAW14_27325 [Streptomyces hygroscopicus]|nr:hypothetical protein [Streptomyces hygroscopicus]
MGRSCGVGFESTCHGMTNKRAHLLFIMGKSNWIYLAVVDSEVIFRQGSTATRSEQGVFYLRI